MLQSTSTKQDILQFLLQRGEATAHDLATTLGISPQATRRHLKDLEAEGAIVHESARGGTGRPQHRYRLSDAGRSRFPDGYDEFAIDLLNTLAETLGPTEMSALLREQWVRRALDYRKRLGSGSLQDRVAKLVELRRAEGYMAEWQTLNPDKLSPEKPSPDKLSPEKLSLTASDPAKAAELAANGPPDGQPPDDPPPEYQPKLAGEVNRPPIAQSRSPDRPRYLLTEHNCAIANVAESYPSVCTHELEMFMIALEGCTVERTHWIVKGEHRCGYAIEERS